MKILCFADLHMCPRASIINKWGKKYPVRLENCIESVNWVEKVAQEQGCELVVNLGDFFDKPDLSSETITASKEIMWSNIQHYSLVGNHDASNSSLTFNSTNSFLSEKHQIITEPFKKSLKDCELFFLPYIVESDRRPLSEYIISKSKKPKIIFSHNDISGIQLGPVVSKTGFSLDEIEENCDLFINGHLHNGQSLTSKVINLGNLTGKDFGEDAAKYTHKIAILDTATLEITYLENPYAFNFYKIQIEDRLDLDYLQTLKDRAVLSIKCNSSMLASTKEALSNLSNQILESRIIITKDNDEVINSEIPELELSVDHLARFVECCHANIENSTLLDEELNEVCK